jgi:hypothetical protein
MQFGQVGHRQHGAIGVASHVLADGAFEQPSDSMQVTRSDDEKISVSTQQDQRRAGLAVDELQGPPGLRWECVERLTERIPLQLAHP